jgi:cytoplasmic iron level regulating protein YaaA (DUF328/UPF0246 family)
MIIFISPAKTFSNKITPANTHTIMLSDTKKLVSSLKKLTSNDIQRKMNVSEKIAQTVVNYYKGFNKELSQAIFTYDGYQYKAIHETKLSEEDLTYLNEHLYIVSGLYGLVKPLDGISHYRLEMKDTSIGNLYTFWHKKFKTYLKTHHSDEIIIDLLSTEYRKAFKGIPTIKIDFYEIINGKKTSVSMHVKRLRGLLVNYLIKHRITDLEQIKNITIDGFIYHNESSTDDNLIFIKEVTHE